MTVAQSDGMRFSVERSCVQKANFNSMNPYNTSKISHSLGSMLFPDPHCASRGGPAHKASAASTKNVNDCSHTRGHSNSLILPISCWDRSWPTKGHLTEVQTADMP